jgi:hypothetical protein
MKILGRILIILAVFLALSGLMVIGVNASGANAPDFNGSRPGFRPGGDGNQFRPDGGQNRHERGDRGGAIGLRWVFGVIKNVGVIALLVTLIVWPKSIAKKKRKQAALSSASDSS